MSNCFYRTVWWLSLVFRWAAFASDLPAKPPPCEFSIAAMERRSSFLGDFYIVVTNRADYSVTLRYFSGPPFEIVYAHAGKQHSLRHKSDLDAIQHGASRAPFESIIPARSTVRFPVDLQGDFVVWFGIPVPVAFRNFAANKAGAIRIKPLDTTIVAEHSESRLVEWDGRKLVVR